MKKAKFLQLFNTLNASEIKAFEKHLKKNFATGSQVFQVYKYIKKNKVDEVKLEKEYALKRIFKQEKVTKSSLTNLLSDLYLALEEFLLWQKFKENKNKELDKMKMEIWRERQLTDWFYRDLEKIKKTIDDTLPNIWTELVMIQLYEQAFYNADLNQEAARHQYLLSAMKHLDEFYFTLKLKYSTDLLNRNELRQENNEIILLEEILNILQKENKQSKPSLLLYYNLVLLIKHKDKNAYKRLKVQLKTFMFANKKEQLVFLLYLVNFTIWSFRNGQLEMGKEVLTIFQYGLDNNLLIVDGVFPPVPYKNIVTASCLLKQYKHASAFNEQWYPYLPESIKQDIYFYCKGAIEFAQGKYDNCLQILNNITFANFSYSREGRSMMIRSFYELDNITSALDASLAYEQYLRRNKVAGKDFVLAGFNFLKIIRKMINGIDSKIILTEVKNLNKLQSKNWFLEKLESK